jgi:hypothetical protein
MGKLPAWLQSHTPDTSEITPHCANHYSIHSIYSLLSRVLLCYYLYHLILATLSKWESNGPVLQSEQVKSSRHVSFALSILSSFPRF